jgi:hypothetical protein
VVRSGATRLRVTSESPCGLGRVGVAGQPQLPVGHGPDVRAAESAGTGPRALTAQEGAVWAVCCLRRRVRSFIIAAIWAR